MKKIVLGISGSIACYKAAFLTRLLTADGWSVRVMMTPAAAEFVGAATFRALSGQAVVTDDWRQPQSADGMEHIAVVRGAAALLVAPASADFLAKAAAGIADNVLLSAFLAADCPKIVAPAMNQQMWAATATQRNIRLLQEDGVTVIGPDGGEQACGEYGPGRLSSPQDIADSLKDLQSPQKTQPARRPQDLPDLQPSQASQNSLLRGLRVVVSTGATVEFIDSMRVLSNNSSGKMGFCIAAAAKAAGATVRLVTAKTDGPPPSDIPSRRAVDGEAMQQVLMEECATADLFFSVAAVADYRPLKRAARKSARQKGDITLKLRPTADILAAVAKKYRPLFCVGFAAQDGAPGDKWVAAARQKMRAKKVQLMVANSTTAAGDDDGEWIIVTAREAIKLPRQSKRQAAAAIIKQVSRETQQEKK